MIACWPQRHHIFAGQALERWTQDLEPKRAGTLMLFDRREPIAFWERIRVSLWPRRSWTRSIKYIYHRLQRLRSTPHAIALGCAFGIFVSFTPFLGCHFVLAGLLSWVSRANIIASALGTFFGNPITYPLIWMSAYKLGSFVLSEEVVIHSIDLSTDFMRQLIEQFWSLMLPLAVGGAPLGVMAAVLSYYPVKRLAEVYQRRRGPQLRSD